MAKDRKADAVNPGFVVVPTDKQAARMRDTLFNEYRAQGIVCYCQNGLGLAHTPHEFCPAPEHPVYVPTMTVADASASSPTRLPDEVPRHMRHGQDWYTAGLCVTCGGEKERREPYHCDNCYSRIFSSIFDYDDD